MTDAMKRLLAASREALAEVGRDKLSWDHIAARMGVKVVKRRRRKPSLATALRQASEAGVKVARAEVGKDGNVVLVFGEPGQQADPLDAELAEFEARRGR
jgi:hypothetical protein